jgi:flagellar biosynthesis protein FlhA
MAEAGSGQDVQRAAGGAAVAGAGTMAAVVTMLRRGDIALALVVTCILAVLILPMPRWMLDISLALSITLSVLIMMVALFIARPLDFNSFPTVLLIATIMRLALNLASTRLILSNGHEGPGAAGQVIQAFGNFVMGGNFVIGLIVFAILVLVNFVVITKGSGRIAEVSARFSLDAMPGKQMAIDADLSAGLINEDEARRRRKDLEDESTFFGSMDGAAKFVRGDAIAGLVITFINIVGGIIIGVAQQDLTLAAAAKSYTVLTVGDGLVSQIPALVVSTAAGLLVSKSGVVGSTDKALFRQLGGYPRALGVSSALMGTLALLPGIPILPFMTLAGLTGTAAYLLGRRQEQEALEEAQAKAAEEAAEPVEEPISSALHIDQIRLELGYGLLALISQEGEQRLTDQIKALRRQVAADMGFVMPAVRIQDNMQLPANGYVVRIKDIEAGRGEVRPNMLLVMDPRGDKIALPGEDTNEPTFGLPAMWVDAGMREEAQFKGYTVVEPSTVVTTHLTEVIKDNMAELLSYADLVPNQISTGGIQRVLQNLLRERVSIRDLPTILEGIADACGYTRNVTFITEHVRTRLARQISESNTGDRGYLPIVQLSPNWEQAFAEALRGEGEEKQLAMPPSKLHEFILAFNQAFERQAMLGETPVLMCSPITRPYIRSIVERVRPVTVVMSQNEVHAKARIKTVDTI